MRGETLVSLGRCAARAGGMGGGERCRGRPGPLALARRIHSRECAATCEASGISLPLTTPGPAQREDGRLPPVAPRKASPMNPFPLRLGSHLRNSSVFAACALSTALALAPSASALCVDLA